MGLSSCADIESFLLHYRSLSPAEKKAYFRAVVDKAEASTMLVHRGNTGDDKQPTADFSTYVYSVTSARNVICDTPEMKKLVEDFRQLPDPVTVEDGDRITYSWTLQYPNTHYTTDSGNTEDMEFVLGSDAMLHPVTIPCKRSLLQLEDLEVSPYVIGLFCQAFVGDQAKRLLELDRASLKHSSPPRSIVRPMLVICRDIRLAFSMTAQAAFLGIELNVSYPDKPQSSFFTPVRNANGSISARKDAVFCNHQKCNVISDDLKVCAVCRLTFYCSLAHQRADWEEHRHMCRQIPKWRKAHDEYEKSGRTRPRFFLKHLPPGESNEEGGDEWLLG